MRSPQNAARHRRRPSARTTRTATAALLGVLAVVTTGGCAHTATELRTAEAAATDIPDYAGGGAAARTDCYDDLEIPYRLEQLPDGQTHMTPLGRDDPAIASLMTQCERLIAAPVNNDLTAYGNAVSVVIIDCLRDRGYTLTVGGGDELTNGNGVSVLSWSTVPAELRDDPTYQSDRTECTRLAESQVPYTGPPS